MHHFYQVLPLLQYFLLYFLCSFVLQFCLFTFLSFLSRILFFNIWKVLLKISIAFHCKIIFFKVHFPMLYSNNSLSWLETTISIIFQTWLEILTLQYASKSFDETFGKLQMSFVISFQELCWKLCYPDHSKCMEIRSMNRSYGLLILVRTAILRFVGRFAIGSRFSHKIFAIPTRVKAAIRETMTRRRMKKI